MDVPNSDSSLDLVLKIFFQILLLFGHDIEMANLSILSNFQPNTSNEGHTEPKCQRLDNQDVEEQGRNYRVTKYSANVINKGERASKVLLSNVRPNRKTCNRRKRTGWTEHDVTGNEMDGAGRTSERRATQHETERNWQKRK